MMSSLDETLGDCTDSLQDALYHLECSDVDDENDILASLHWGIKDLLEEITKYRKESK